MTQLDDSRFTNAVFAAWYDCNWDHLDSLLDTLRVAIISVFLPS